MEATIDIFRALDNTSKLTDSNILAELNTQDTSPVKSHRLITSDGSSDEDAGPQRKVRKRVQQFSDSDTEKENVQNHNDENKQTSDSETEEVPFKSTVTKSRIQLGATSSDSDDAEEAKTVKNEEQQMRMKNKRNKMQQKFKGLLNSRSKLEKTKHVSDGSSSDEEKSNHSESEASDNEMSSISNIKQKIKKSMTMMPSICDPDTSDEEDNMNKKQVSKQKQKKEQKSAKMIEAKPIRMSAKQAMENMHLIKSESNRMLREKAVSLPYHRPKALSLKDIMARRKPALTSDGKALPIKMNEEQLKQYALQLEQRQKEMMELCKSESEDEDADPEQVSGSPEQALVNPESESVDPKPESVDLEQVPVQDESEKKEGQTDMDILEPNNTEQEEENTNIVNNILTENKYSPQEDTDDNTLKEVEDVPDTESNTEENKTINESVNSETNQNDSNTDIKLVYNDDSIEEDHVAIDKSEDDEKEVENEINEEVSANSELQQESEPQEHIPKVCSEQESQLISLHYTDKNTEDLDETNAATKSSNDEVDLMKDNENTDMMDVVEDDKQNDFFSDDDVDVNMEDIDRIIESAEMAKDDDIVNSPMLIKDPINMKPKIMGAPGMVIDLDGDDPMPKRSGIELLKERFTYFSKLKTPEELEREREKKLKPGAQHLKLKQELEEKIAEQRSLEWAKRLEEEKQLHEEMDSILDDADEADDSIEKIKSNLDKQDDNESSESEGEEEPVEDDIEIKDKPRKHNPMVDDEAEESDIEENDEEAESKQADEDEAIEEDNGDKDEGDDASEEDEESSEEEESSESEEELETTKTKKGRILKAFEDSDDEDATTKDVNKQDMLEKDVNNTEDQNKIESAAEANEDFPIVSSCEIQASSQDDVIQLAQRHKSVSDDLFTSQENCTPSQSIKDGNGASDEVMGTQTFSISSAKPAAFLCESQPYHDPALNAITDGISPNDLSSQLPTESQSQPIGEDILALCTGQFYDNQFVSQSDDKPTDTMSQTADMEDNIIDNDKVREVESSKNKNLDTIKQTEENTNNADTIKLDENDKSDREINNKSKEDGNLLKSILDELDDPEFDKPKPNKFFTGASNKKSEIEESVSIKKRLIIDSDEETNENMADEGKKKKKKKLEKRALQISDDEEEEEEDGYGLEEDEYASDLGEDGERLVEYDSEENEIEVKPDKEGKPKKKRKTTEFFENEAELTSEDEWVGSGDEDEHGLDRMEREEGDDDVFHQGKLRKELGQIHMRDVLDQDKREVRIIQELLFEDGDLGGGHRQRKFRWRNAGDEEAGTIPDEFADTQEEEFESEEQWRKQRHEREVFLRQMQKQDEDQSLNVTVNRTTIIKANLSSKSMSALLMEVNQTKTETTESPAAPEKKTAKDIPSPKKGFSILQQNYHGSLLTRGRGALARLAALATPLAADDDAPKIGSLAPHKRNFVFAALTQEEEKPKVTIKRKADANAGTPKLVKKMRIEEKSQPKSSLLDHFKL